ncbi:hypothetical protein ACFLFM_003296 [Salmonella enterica]|nr:hypothetical protein [Salmonella enterica]HCM6303653.1 hypothetical protein [Salmonella enterica subsp. enterica serovar 6,14:y:1,7]
MNVNILMKKISLLEDAARRGIEMNKKPVPGIPAGKVISCEQCEWTLKNCAIFRHWINDLDPGTVGLRQSLDGR